MGLSELEQKEVFKPFARLDAHSNIEGTGIGLPISRNLVELMGGTLGVDSQKGKGSTFYFDLQLVDERSTGLPEGDKIYKEKTSLLTSDQQYRIL